MTAATRGSWLMHRGIVDRWKDQSLDDAFKVFWSDSAITQYRVLHEMEAPPSPPGPYCIYEVADPTILGHATGPTRDTEIQTQLVVVTLRVHARASGSKDGKEICKTLIEQVAAAYDGFKGLSVEPDTIVTVQRAGDFSIRESTDDGEWSWTLRYEYTVDALYNV